MPFHFIFPLLAHAFSASYNLYLGKDVWLQILIVHGLLHTIFHAILLHRVSFPLPYQTHPISNLH